MSDPATRAAERIAIEVECAPGRLQNTKHHFASIIREELGCGTSPLTDCPQCGKPYHPHVALRSCLALCPTCNTERRLVLIADAEEPTEFVPLTWTPESPKEPGWYWWRDRKDGHPAVVMCWFAGKTLYCDRTCPAKTPADTGGQWSGPLRPPE